MPRKVKCTVRGCKGIAVARGLCRSCHRSALRHVRDGLTTWDKLEKSGIAKPRKLVPKIGKALGLVD